MSFYLLSEGLTFVGIFSGAYESLKVLSRAEKGVETSTLSAILEFWVVLAVTAVFEQYAELFVSWFPFYYLFKCAFLGLLLTPNTKFAHVLYDGFVEPGVAKLKHEFDASVQPVLETLVLKHGHWFHQQLLARSLSLFNERELLELERELQSKLSDVQEELRDRHRCLKAENHENHGAIEGETI
ncbi:hypothetical protein Gpo141_00000492 [Globisporangium polare]